MTVIVVALADVATAQSSARQILRKNALMFKLRPREIEFYKLLLGEQAVIFIPARD